MDVELWKQPRLVRNRAAGEMPGGIAYTERRPAHGSLSITGLDGVRREIATTAFPLFGPDEEFHGIMVIFWEQA